MNAKQAHTIYKFREQLERSLAERAMRDQAALLTLFPQAQQITMATHREDRQQKVDYWVWWDDTHRDGWNAKQLGANSPDPKRWLHKWDPELPMELELHYPDGLKLGWAVAPPPPRLHGYLFTWPAEQWPMVYGIQAQALHAAIRNGIPYWRGQPGRFKLKERFVLTERDDVTWQTLCSFPRLSSIILAMGMSPEIDLCPPGIAFVAGYVPEQVRSDDLPF